jgi:S-adenosylmethionine hydrolase
MVAQVLWVDRFGNAQLNVPPAAGPFTTVTIGERTESVRTVPAYGDLNPGAPGLVVDSYGLLSICVRQESAAARLGLEAGSVVTLGR